MEVIKSKVIKIIIVREQNTIAPKYKKSNEFLFNIVSQKAY